MQAKIGLNKEKPWQGGSTLLFPSHRFSPVDVSDTWPGPLTFV